MLLSGTWRAGRLRDRPCQLAWVIQAVAAVYCLCRGFIRFGVEGFRAHGARVSNDSGGRRGRDRVLQALVPLSPSR